MGADYQNEKKSLFLNDVVRIESTKISVDEINVNDYISTENMVPNLGGVFEAKSKPLKGSVTEFQKDDILISNIRPYLKKIWFSDKKGGCSSDVLVFRIKNDEIDSKYLFYLLSSDKFFNYVMTTSKGTKMPRGDKKAILKFKIKLPALIQQKNYANFLSLIDKKIELLEKSKKRIEIFNFELINKIMKQNYKIPNHNNEWVRITLKDIGQSYTGLSGKNKDDFNKGNSKFIPYISIFNDIILDTSNFENVYVGENENQNSVSKGDIFFTASSETPKEVGMSSVILEDLENCYLNSFCFGFRLKSFEQYNPLFLVYYFRSLKFRKELYKLAQGSTRFNISKKELLKKEIEVPSKIEQDYYVNLINSVFEKNENINKELLHMNNFKKGLLQKMFV